MAAVHHNRAATIVRKAPAHATMGTGMRTGVRTATRVHTTTGVHTATEIPTKTDRNTRVIPITATTNAAFNRNKNPQCNDFGLVTNQPKVLRGHDSD
jgi:hypothetical protein